MKPAKKIYSFRTGTAWLTMFVLLAAFTGISCVKEGTEPSVPPASEEKTIHMRIAVPASSVGQNTRSITGREENNISTLHIISFRIEDDNSERFDYWTQGTQLEKNDNGSPAQDFSATVKIRNHLQRFVLLANIGDETKQRIEQGNWKGVEKGQMLAQLEERMNGPELKWNAHSSTDYRPIPMWGESKAETISENTVSLTETIPLLRMVAKIDVQLDESVAGLTDKFRLTSVRLYNTNTKGRLVPEKNNIEDVTVGGRRTITAKAPSIPSDIADYSERYLGPVLYEDFFAPGQQDIAIRSAIYLFETASATEHSEATCLVIGGIYGPDMHETFYRVDFVRKDRTTISDILRNHIYTVNITDVKRSGHTDPQEAFRTKGENITASILVWDVADMDEVWFDEQYYYSVSPRNLEFKAGAVAGNTIKVLTDYPEWSYELSDMPNPGNPQANPLNVGWVTVNSHQPNVKYEGQSTPAHIYYNVAVNDGIIPRTAYIHISAGRVTMKVTIHQGYSLVESVTIDPTGDIPTMGQTRTVTAIGVFESLEVRARDILSGEIIDQNIINFGQHGSRALLHIPSYQSNSFPAPPKTIAFEYYDPQISDWIIIRTDRQQGTWFDISIDHPQDDNIPGIGRYYTVSIQGDYPQLYLRSATDDDKLWEGSPVVAGSAERVTEIGQIYVPVNGTQIGRKVYLEYSADRISWATISSGTQTSDHFKLVTGRLVARQDMASVMDWTGAMSVPPIYKSQYYYSTYGIDSDNFDYTPVATVGTGCGIYAEAIDASDRGMWRLPTWIEVNWMCDSYQQIGGFADSDRRYWTSSETDFTLSASLTVPGKSKNNSNKGLTFWVRCVMAVD